MGSFVSVDQLLTPSPFRRLAVDRPVMDRLKELDGDSLTRAEIVLPTLEEGEQYRFHIDMTSCIGCRCCEVACNEQNNNPAHVTWRRVGEVEAGAWPKVQRLHLSMSCNHCLEPSCLEGCPTEAYSKRPDGIVAHNAEACIGCQYCIWNCPYGVPQYHPERHIVTKCHLCVDRIEAEELPACVEACPVNAIEIEKVNVAQWRNAIDQANAPGVPPADITLSTTRITYPQDLPETFGQKEVGVPEPEAPHWSLNFFLLFGQWSVGLFGLAALGALTGQIDPSVVTKLTLVASALGFVGMAAAVFHLGRPLHAFKALQAWKRSWLSREVIAFGLFGVLGAIAATVGGLRWSDGMGEYGSEKGWEHGSMGVWECGSVQVLALGLTFLVGLAGIACSAGIYLIPARPAWCSWRTPAQFFLTAVHLASAFGLFCVRATEGPQADSWNWTLAIGVAVSALAQAFLPWTLIIEGIRSEDAPVRASATLLSHTFSRLLWGRTALLCLAAFAAPLAVTCADPTAALAAAGAALVAGFLGELIGRYLFFVTVVPRNIAGSFLAGRTKN